MKLVSIVLFAVFVPAVAAAQNRGIYIQAGPVADILFSPSVDDFPVGGGPRLTASPSQPGGPSSTAWLSIGFPSFDRVTSRSRVSPGAAAALGVFITPSVSLRVEGSHQGEHTITNTSEVAPVLSIVDRQSVSATDLFVAAGWHQGESRRASITYLAGMVFRRQHDEASVEYNFSPRMLPPTIGQPSFPSGFPSNAEFGATTYHAGIMAGVDVAITFSTHFALVPQLRMVAAANALSVRPAVSVRWQP